MISVFFLYTESHSFLGKFEWKHSDFLYGFYKKGNIFSSLFFWFKEKKTRLPHIHFPRFNGGIKNRIKKILLEKNECTALRCAFSKLSMFIGKCQ